MFVAIIKYIKQIKEFSLFEIGIDGEGEEFLKIEFFTFGTEDDDRSLFALHIDEDSFYLELFWMSISDD